jgi:hypothetical protein
MEKDVPMNKLSKLFTLCPLLSTYDDDAIAKAVGRMVNAHAINGHAVTESPITIAIAYMETIKSPPKQELR